MTVGDALDNALAESFVDSYKTELIVDRVWRSHAQVERATVAWVRWFNHDRLHSSLGDIPPVELEHRYAAANAVNVPIALDGSVTALLAATRSLRQRSDRSNRDPLRPRPRQSKDERLRVASPT